MQVLAGLLQRLIGQPARFGDSAKHLDLIDPQRIDQTVTVVQANVAGESDFHRDRVQNGHLAPGDRHAPDVLGQTHRQGSPARSVEEHRHALQHVQIKQHAGLESGLFFDQGLPQQDARQPVTLGIGLCHADHIQQAPARWQVDRARVGNVTADGDRCLADAGDQQQTRR
ncbi:hypothetical protein D3C81_1387810 [compost metagenome]